jgi:hypothetical protein
LINNTSAVDLKHRLREEPPATAAAEEEEKPPKPVAWLKDTLPACPDDKNRTIMDDGKTHIVKYPFAGAVCQLQLEDEIGNSELVYLYEGETCKGTTWIARHPLRQTFTNHTFIKDIA